MCSTAAHSVLLSRYARTFIRFKAWQLSHSSGFHTSEKDDLEQELWAALAAQAPNFNCQRASAQTYINRVVRAQVGMIRRARSAERRCANARVLSLDQPAEHTLRPLAEQLTEDCDHRQCQYTSEDLADRRLLSESVREAVAQMPAHVQQVCEALMQSPVATVARQLGISRRQVRAAVDIARRHLNHLNSEELTEKADICDSDCICVKVEPLAPHSDEGWFAAG